MNGPVAHRRAAIPATVAASMWVAVAHAAADAVVQAAQPVPAVAVLRLCGASNIWADAVTQVAAEEAVADAARLADVERLTDAGPLAAADLTVVADPVRPAVAVRA